MAKGNILKIGALVSTLVLCPFFVSPSIAIECGNSLVSTVPGEYIPLPPVDFIEEWDNGLTGNHPWIHHTFGHDPDFGYVINEIEYIGDGVLFKDNVRDIGEDNYVLNETVFNFYNTPSYMPGIPVTPETYVEFRIDDLSINELTPAREGYTSSWQYFALHFNSGPDTDVISIQFSEDGQWAPSDLFSSPTAHYYVSLGQDTAYNIHSAFQQAGIEIPEPLFLGQAIFNQTLWDLSDPSNVEHQQHMEVDYLRVLDGRE